MSEKQRKWLLAGIKILILALLVWFVRKSLYDAFESLRAYQNWQLEPGWLILAGVFYLIGMVPPAVFGQRLMAGVGHPVPMLEALRAFYLSQLGKYVPGKAMVLVLRAGLLRRAGVGATLVAAVVFIETLTSMASGSLVAAICLGVWHPDRKVLLLAAIGMFFANGLPMLPPVFRFVVRLLHVTKLNLEMVYKLEHVKPRIFVVGWLTLALAWVVQGLSMWAIMAALGKADTSTLLSDLPLLTASVALAVVAGFLALIPAGLGVREFVIIPLLAPVYGGDIAVVSAIILRLVTLAAELVAGGIFYLVPTAVARPAEVDGTPAPEVH